MFDHLLVPLDTSSLAECVLPHAVTLARAFEARITLLHVVARDGSQGSRETFVNPLDWQVRKAEAKAYLDELAARFTESGLQVEVVLLEGPAAERIVEFAHEHQAGLIVIGTHGQSGLSGWNVSSVVQKVILRAHVPLMIVRAYVCPTRALAEIEYERLVVPLDGSRRAEHVLSLATTLAHRSGAQLILAYLVSRPDVPRHIPLTEEESQLVNRLVELNRASGAAYLKELQKRLPPGTETHLVVSEDPAAGLHDLVEQRGADVVALSAHGSADHTRWPYGWIPLNFIAYGTTPLLIVQDLSPQELADAGEERMMRQPSGH